MSMRYDLKEGEATSRVYTLVKKKDFHIFDFDIQ